MKQLRHVLALTLVFCMVFGMVTPSFAVSGEISVEEDYGIPVEEDDGIEIEVDEDREELSVLPKRDETADENDTTDSSENVYKYSIIHLDCGRKYFSVDSIKKIIDNAAAAGFNYIQLAVGNDGMRFLLDDMSVTVESNAYGTNAVTYTSDAVKAAIKAGNLAYNATAIYNNVAYTPDDGKNELTQAEMDTIIAYASSKGMGVIPLINTPGHMDAILSAATSLTGKTCSYNGSVRTIDVTKTIATDFTKAFLQKYIDYFAGKGCKYFNMGADEYANDIYDSGSMGFGKLQEDKNYGDYITYINDVADKIDEAGMTPIAFNDGIYFADDTSSGTIHTNILIEYWSNGWSGYSLRTASNLKKDGFSLINTNGSYYWVLGKTGAQCSADKAKEFDETVFPLYEYGTFKTETVSNPVGSTFCIWCDYPGDGTEEEVISNTAATIAAFKGVLPKVESGASGGTTEPTDPTEQTVTVSIGQTVDLTQDGVNNESNVVRTELNEGIATVEVTGTDGVASSITLGSKIDVSDNTTSKGVITDNNGHYMVVDSEGTLSSTTDIKEATEFTVTRSYSYYDGYTISTGSYYLYIYSSGSWWNTSYGLGVRNSSYSWSYSNNSGFYKNYIVYSNNDWTLSTSTSNSGYLYTKSRTDAVPASTTIKITGVAEGTTYVTVGNVRYTINVVKEDLTKVSPITVEYWITNRQVTADGATSKTVSANDSTIYSEDGVAFADIAPKQGTFESNVMVYWKGKRLTSSNKQTTDKGNDKTQSGDDFAYIRYWNGKWSFSTDRKTWNDFNSTDQIVAYYMQRTNLTDEVETEVVDWSVVPHTDYTYNESGYYTILDFAVKYETGDRTPDSFPTPKTMGFHCSLNDGNLDTTVFRTTDKKTYYRRIGAIRANETSDYEIYMITLTPTSDTATEVFDANLCSRVTEIEYDGTEKVIWVDKEEDLGEFADESTHYTSPSKLYNYHVGGEAVVPGVEIYNKQAMLVTYYVRAKVTEDSLTVHYIDKTLNEEFYNYNIAVANGTHFAQDFAKGTADNTLVNNTVTNINGKVQTVNPDLKTMPEISAYYRYSSFKLESVTRTDKEVWLYYTFNNTHNFVVDFGVPLHLEPSDIGLDTSGTQTWDKAELTAGNKQNYGIADISAGNGLTYTPTSVMSGVETIGITLSDSNSTAKPATHFIYLYPATNVLYEENVLTQSEGTNKSWTEVGTSTLEGYQATEELGKEDIHGYDEYYSENTGFSGGSAYVAALEADDTQVSTKTALTFKFTGTGFDLISECGTNTGSILVRLKDSNGNLKKGYFVDTYFTGDAKYITGTGILDYQVPVVRDLELDYGSYVAEIYGYMIKRNDASAASVNSLDSSESYLAQALNEFGFDDDLSLYEVSYMDENSVLNGGNGAEVDVVKSTSSLMSANMADEINTSLVNEETTQTGYIYVDGVRVYNTINTSNQPDYKASEKNTEYYNVYDFAEYSAVDNYEENTFIYVEYDGDQSIYTIATYKAQGPENEIYLTPGHGIAFALDGFNEGDTVQVSAKIVNPIAGNATLRGLAGTEQIKTTSTEMYYNVDVSEGYVLLTNDTNSKSIISISALKVTSNIKAYTSPEFAELIKGDKQEFEPQTFEVRVPSTIEYESAVSMNIKASASDVQKVEYKIVGESQNADEVAYISLKPDNERAVNRGKSKCYLYGVGIFTGSGAGELTQGKYTVIVRATSKENKTCEFKLNITVQ